MRYDTVVLAEGCRFSSDTEATGLNNNQIIVGGSGSGKTMSVTEPCLLYTANRNLIVTATKARIVDKYHPVLQSRGYQVDLLNFSDLSRCTVGFDPLRFVQTDADVTFLARSLVLANPRKEQSRADPYWDEAGISLLSALIHLVRLQGERRRVSFADVALKFKQLRIKYGGANVQTNLDGLFELLEAEQPGNLATAHWESFCHLPGRTAACVVSALSATISYLFHEDLLGMMRMESQVDFHSFLQGKQVLFLVTSPVNPALSNLVSLFYATAMKELFELAEHCPNGRLPIPVHMICDDFATGAPIPDFAQYISIIREKGLSVTLLCQSESQLESLYSQAEAVTIINNCDTYVFTGGMDLKTARNISTRLNVPVDEVLALPLGQFVVFRRGQRPIMARRYPILEDPLHQQLLLEREEMALDKAV